MSEDKFRQFCMLVEIYGLDENSPERVKIHEWLNRIGYVGGPNMLDQRAVDIVIDYFWERKTYDQIAVLWHISRERIRQIISKSLRIIKSKSNKELLLAYIFPQFKELVDKRTAKEKELMDICQQIALFKRDRIVEQPQSAREKSIRDLELSVRTENALREKSITTIGELCECSETELLSIRNFGKKCLEEVKIVLNSMGLYLAKES